MNLELSYDDVDDDHVDDDDDHAETFIMQLLGLILTSLSTCQRDMFTGMAVFDVLTSRKSCSIDDLKIWQ
jgi:hypothetical protein